MIQVVAQASGWNPGTIITAVLAGIAAATGLTSILMNRHLQHDQQRWQEGVEGERRSWEASQERERRDWQEAQVVHTRWDDYKRSLYAEFLSATDRLFDTSSELANVRNDLAEDLASLMGVIEEHYWETDRARLEAMDGEERAAFWREEHDRQVGFFKERRSELVRAQDDLRRLVAARVGELHLIAPDHIRQQADELSHLSEQPMYGSSFEAERKRAVAREKFIADVRDDLRIPGSAGDGG